MKKPTRKPRTKKRFAYRNAAVMQGTILADAKLLLITCAEFAQDDGTFHHGQRSLAVATEYSLGHVKNLMDSLIARGAIERTHRGFAPGNSSHYRLNLNWLEDQPSIYDLVRQKNLKNEPTVLRTVPTTQRTVAFTPRTEPFTARTKDIELDVDVGNNGDRDAAGDTPCTPVPERQSPRQPQRSTPVNGKGKLGQATPGCSSQPELSAKKSKSNPTSTPKCAECPRPIWRERWCEVHHTEGVNA